MTLRENEARFKLFDTHAHPQFAQFDADRDAVIARALDSGIGIICVGVDLVSSKKAIALAELYDGLWATVGLHPNDNLGEEYTAREYIDLSTHPKVVAIGEIGLDYYRMTDAALQHRQRERFMAQLDLVRESGKPAIIHC